MDLLRRKTRGTPEPKEIEEFWDRIKTALAVASATGAVAHPALGLLSVGAEAINQVQSRVASRRSEELVQDIAGELYFAHLDHKLSIEQIRQVISSEQFNSALLQARLIATRTHHEEKLDALRNAVLNVALGREQEGNRQEQFLSLVERFTGQHLTLLRFF